MSQCEFLGFFFHSLSFWVLSHLDTLTTDHSQGSFSQFLRCFCSDVFKLMISFKNGHEIHHLTNNQLFPQCIVATTGSSGRSYGELYCTLIEPIRSFLASRYSRRGSKTWRLLDIRISTNLTDTFISSQKTKNSVPPKPWDRPGGAGCFRVWRMFDRTEQDKEMTGQGRTVQDDDRRGCFPRL